jgi:hypothetical protein
VAARRAEYEEHRRRRAEIERRWEELGTAYIGPEPLEIGVNVDLDEFVATLRAMSPEAPRATGMLAGTTRQGAAQTRPTRWSA